MSPAAVTYNEKELLLQIAGGDESAFTTLFNTYSSQVYSVAFSFTKNRVVSEEIVQDIFLNIWLKRDILQGIDDVRNWLFIVARNKSFSVLQKMAAAERRSRRIAEGREAHESLPPGAEQVIESREFLNIIQEAISLLTPQQQKVFELIKVHGYSRNEAAEALGLSAHTVKAHMSQALPVVRGFLVKRLGSTIAVLLFGVFFR